MNTATRLTLFGAALVAVFGAAYGVANALAPADVAANAPATEGMAGHGDAEAHDHPADGGAPPAGIEPAASPTYPVGTEVRIDADHMDGMAGATGVVSGAFTTTTYAVSYTPTTGGDPVVDHRWVVHEELSTADAAPLPVGTVVTLQAAHMPGMQGAQATISGATSETVYMVDFTVDGTQFTRHKWVVESELAPVA